jgi:hypothetical protein
MEHLQDFIKLYNPENRNKRTETWSEENPEGRWRKFTYAEIIERDKTNLRHILDKRQKPNRFGQLARPRCFGK